MYQSRSISRLSTSSILFSLAILLMLLLCWSDQLQAQILEGSEENIQEEIRKLPISESGKGAEDVKAAASEFILNMTRLYPGQKITIEKLENGFNLAIETPDRLKGKVAISSRVPYNFYLTPQNGQIKLGVSADNGKVDINLNDHLSASAISDQERKEIVESFTFLLRPLRPRVEKALLRAKDEGEVQLGRMSFGHDAGRKKVVVEGIRSNERSQDKIEESIELLHSNLDNEKYAKSAVNFGCMLLSRHSPKIPAADAEIIIRLLEQMKKKGKDKDGRMVWEKI